MRLIFSENAWEDYQHWIKSDTKVVNRINQLIKDASRNPFDGIGKLEPLKQALAGYWSRLINDEHRTVYKIEEDSIQIAQLLRYHY